MSPDFSTGVEESPPPEAPPDPEPVLAHLATLDPVAYDQCREATAKALGIRLTTLDAAVAARRPHPPDPPPEPDSEPKPTPEPEPDRQPAPPQPRPFTLPLGDYTNALAFVHDHGQNVRYCEAWKKWLIWSGTHWEYRLQGPIKQKAKDTIKRLLRQAGDLPDDQYLAWMAHVRKSLQSPALSAMVESAQSEPGIPVEPTALDQKPWLLNCLNGTLDLQTGTRHKASRADLLTHCLQVAYDPDATCPTWDAFLDRIMGGNQELKDFFQRAIGYALTGVIREHILPILWGEGSNGKSTCLNTLRNMLGTYAMKAPSELLMVSHNDRHPTERADLLGKRFVTTIETEKGRRLAEVFVKEATGGDPIRARRMREDFWEFQPTHHLFLATNHKPDIPNTDHAIWRRIRLVPFTVIIPEAEQDGTLPAKLKKEWPGILAWAVRGCTAWNTNGLGEPEAVLNATKAYRAEQDVLGQFLQQCCQEGPLKRVKANDLFEAYKQWGGVEHQREFGKGLTERGYERFTNNGVWYRGLGLHQSPQGERKDTQADSNKRHQTEPSSKEGSVDLPASSLGETTTTTSNGTNGSEKRHLSASTPSRGIQTGNSVPLVPLVPLTLGEKTDFTATNGSGLGVSQATFPAAEKIEDVGAEVVSRAFPKAERSKGTLDTRTEAPSTMTQAAGNGERVSACALAAAVVTASCAESPTHQHQMRSGRCIWCSTLEGA